MKAIPCFPPGINDNVKIISEIICPTAQSKQKIKLPTQEKYIPNRIEVKKRTV
jgi:hypothetical protein